MSQEVFDSKNQDYEKIVWTATDILRPRRLYNPLDAVSLCAMAYLVRKTDAYQVEELQKIIDDEVIDYAVKGHLLRFTVEFWEEIKQLSHVAGMKDLKAAALLCNVDTEQMGMINTPDSLIKLVSRVLDINEHDSVYDQCSGMGSFLTRVALTYPATAYHGAEINSDMVIISKIRSWLLDDFFDIYNMNVFKMDVENVRATKVFSNHPWGLMDRQLAQEVKNYSNYATYLKDIPVSKCLDWAFILSALEAQQDGGKTVVVVPTNSLSRARSEAELRKKLTVNGKLEAIIELPERMFAYTALSASLLVFSEGNSAVRMVDASGFGKRMKMTVTFSAEDIDEIIALIDTDNKKSILVSHDTMEKNEFNWCATRYLALENQTIDNGVYLKDLVLEVRRGMAIPAKDLEKITSDKETDYQYLMLQHINDNKVDKNLTFIDSLDPKWEKALVHDGELLISRTAPFKSAVMENENGHKVMANGGLFILKLDTSKVNPYYVMLYLRSQQGQAQLNSISHGAVMISFAQKDLDFIMIPMIPMKKQKEIVVEYKKLRNKLEEIRREERNVRVNIDKLL